mgnify:CR=1 FL=1
MQTATRIGAALFAALTIGGNAMSDVVTVLDPEQRIITNNDWQVGIFESKFTIKSYFSGMPPDMQLDNSLRLSFREGPPFNCAIIGNSLPTFPPEPFRTPALYSAGGLDLFDTVLDYSNPTLWHEPFYDGDSGTVEPALLFQNSVGGDFSIDAFDEGDFAYIGYSTSDNSVFGYMQIMRGLTRTEWRLVGYAFDPTGAPVVVRPLPSGPTALLGLASLALLRNRSQTT